MGRVVVTRTSLVEVTDEVEVDLPETWAAMSFVERDEYLDEHGTVRSERQSTLDDSIEHESMRSVA